MRYTAIFTPQAWIRDYAIEVDPEGPTEWDVTSTLLAQSPELRDKSMVSDSHESDELRWTSHAPKWVQDWSGPFYITVVEIND